MERYIGSVANESLSEELGMGKLVGFDLCPKPVPLESVLGEIVSVVILYPSDESMTVEGPVIHVIDPGSQYPYARGFMAPDQIGMAGSVVYVESPKYTRVYGRGFRGSSADEKLSTDNHYNYFVDCLKCEDDDQGFVYHLIQHKAWAGAPAERSELNANWYRGGK